jgi:hypothetical protein
MHARRTLGVRETRCPRDPRLDTFEFFTRLSNVERHNPPINGRHFPASNAADQGPPAGAAETLANPDRPREQRPSIRRYGRRSTALAQLEFNARSYDVAVLLAKEAQAGQRHPALATSPARDPCPRAERLATKPRPVNARFGTRNHSVPAARLSGVFGKPVCDFMRRSLPRARSFALQREHGNYPGPASGVRPRLA